MKRKDVVVFACCCCVALLLKMYFFTHFNMISKDDYGGYIPLAANLLSHHSLTLDGKTPHTVFPPGYPFLLAIERSLMGGFERVFFFNYVIVTTLTSLVILLFFIRQFPRENVTVSIPMLFLYPYIITSNKISSASSEYLYALCVWGGVYYLYAYLFERQKNVYLFAAGFLLSYSYLMRPEALLVVAAVPFIVLWRFKRQAITGGAVFAYLAPVVVIVGWYVYFLYSNLGEFVLSGKQVLANAYIVAHKIDRVALCKSNVLGVLKIFIAPNVINPIILICGAFFVALLVKGSFAGEERRKLLLLLVFPALIMALLIPYKPIERALYAFIPMLLVVCVVSINRIMERFRINPAVAAFCIALFFVASVFAPSVRANFYNDPFLYKEAGRFILETYGEARTILARDPRLTYYAGGSVIPFDHAVDSDEPPDLLVVSNLTHSSLVPIGEAEAEAFMNPVCDYKGHMYRRARDFGNRGYFVKIFTRDDWRDKIQ